MLFIKKTHIKQTVILPLLLLLGCQPSMIKEGEHYTAAQTDKLFVVDCLLPGQMRKLGKMTYLTSRRPIQTTAGECETRGGEYVAYDRANYASSLKVWLPQAKEGNAKAQVIVGEMYEKGLGSLADPAIAAQWYRKAAAQGDSSAQINLGHLYEKGLGVEQSLPTALNWYRKASGLDNTDLEFASVTEATVSAGYEEQLGVLREESAGYQQQADALSQQLSTARQNYQNQQNELTKLQSQLSRSRQSLSREKNKKQGNQQLIQQLEQQLQDNQSSIDQQKLKLAEIQQTVEQSSTTPSTASKSILLSSAGIEIIEPPMLLTRGVPSYQLRAIRKTKKVIGKIDKFDQLLSLTINGETVAVDLKGMFRTDVAINEDLTPVKIIANYQQGSAGQLDFNLLAKSSESPALDLHPPMQAVSTDYASVNFGRFYALVIGNKNYAQLTDLKTSVNDARSVEETLRVRYGYKTTLLINANRHQIMTAFNDLRQLLTEKDNLLIYYAGHGEIDKSDQSAYWLPTDAESDNSANWLSSHSITQYLNIMAAKHILVVADSCYSGAMTKSAVVRLPGKMAQEKRTKWLNFMVKRKARTVITSGGVKPVLDSDGGKHSIFARAFLSALKQNNGLIEDYELFRSVANNVQKSAASVGFQQSPQYSAMLHAGHQGSPYFFLAQK
ncbi:MAG: peptidase C14 [Methyloprofundus sp.]|nr:peptidase C14 [Methyloprofundus sp.]